MAPAAHRIVDLRWNGQPLDDAAAFAVVTNNYRASGGGNFPGLDGSQIVVNPAPGDNIYPFGVISWSAGSATPSSVYSLY